MSGTEVWFFGFTIGMIVATALGAVISSILTRKRKAPPSPSPDRARWITGPDGSPMLAIGGYQPFPGYGYRPGSLDDIQPDVAPLPAPPDP